MLLFERGIPRTLDFAVPDHGPDPFLASVRTLLWWLGLGTLGILVALRLSICRWIGDDGSASEGLATAGDRRPRRGVLISAGLAMVLLATLDAPRLSESLWNDELWSLQESVHGLWHRDLGGIDDAAEVLTEIYWQPVDWEHAVWRYDTTNHHYLLNILAKAGLSIWQWSSGAEDWEFDETALRILPFLFALGGLVTWALFLRGLGYASAAMLLPWALAFHPWYQRYATGMRGYPLVFFFLPLVLLFAVRALRGGTWRCWLAFAGCQFLLMYSWPAGAVIMLAFNACLAISVWRRWAGSAKRPDQIKRWAIANLATLLALLPLVLPGVFQIGTYLQEDIFRHDMGLPWFKNVVCLFFSGCAWPEIDSYSARSGFHVAGETLFQAHPVIFSVVAVAAAGLFAGGLAKLIRERRREALLLVCGLALGPVASYLKAISAPGGPDIFIFEWYLIFALPFVCAIAAIGLASAARLLAASIWRGTAVPKYAPASLGLMFLAAYVSVVFPRTLALLKSSADPRRESVEAIRGGLHLTDPANSEILTAHVFRSALVYDPRGWIIKTGSNDSRPAGSPPGLTQLMRIADTHDLTLFVNVGYPSEAKTRYPDIFELLETPELFRVSSRHFGLEPQFERAVYRYRGGMFKFDFSRPKS